MPPDRWASTDDGDGDPGSTFRSGPRIRNPSAGYHSTSPMLLRRRRGNWVKARVSVWNPHKLGLRPVDRVAENPAASRAVGVHPPAAYSHLPHAEMQEIKTRSPGWKAVTPGPTFSTTPTPSWPRMRPGRHVVTSPLRICRSVPQIVVLTIFTTASPGATGSGTGRSSRAFFQARDRRVPSSSLSFASRRCMHADGACMLSSRTATSTARSSLIEDRVNSWNNSFAACHSLFSSVPSSHSIRDTAGISLGMAPGNCKACVTRAVTTRDGASDPSAVAE